MKNSCLWRDTEDRNAQNCLRFGKDETQEEMRLKAKPRGKQETSFTGKGKKVALFPGSSKRPGQPLAIAESESRSPV